MARTDSTKKRARKIVLILLVLLVALVIGFLVVYSRMDQLGMVPVAREDIPETFRKEVPGEQEYTDVLVAEGEEHIACLGYYGSGSAGEYAAFSKLPLVDLWVLDLMSTGSLTYTNPNGYMGWKDNVRAYPSLNIDRVEKIVLRVDGQEKEIAVDPQDPFVVIAEGEFEGMTLYTVDGKERTERDFPMPVTDSEVREGGVRGWREFRSWSYEKGAKRTAKKNDNLLLTHQHPCDRLCKNLLTYQQTKTTTSL